MYFGFVCNTGSSGPTEMLHEPNNIQDFLVISFYNFIVETVSIHIQVMEILTYMVANLMGD